MNDMLQIVAWTLAGIVIAPPLTLAAVVAIRRDRR